MVFWGLNVFLAKNPKRQKRLYILDFFGWSDVFSNTQFNMYYKNELVKLEQPTFLIYPPNHSHSAKEPTTQSVNGKETGWNLEPMVSTQGPIGLGLQALAICASEWCVHEIPVSPFPCLRPQSSFRSTCHDGKFLQKEHRKDCIYRKL